MPILSFLLLIPFKDSGPVLFPGICQHGLGRNERETATTYQLLLKQGHYGLPISMHSRGVKALPQRARNYDCTKALPPKIKSGMS